MSDFDVFCLLEFRKRTARSHGIKKNGHCMLSCLSSLPISVLHSLDRRLINFTIELTYYIMLLYLQGVILQMLFVQSLIPKLIIQDLLSKFFLLIKELTLLTYRVFSVINPHNHPYQKNSRIVKYQSFVINIINLLGALYPAAGHVITGNLKIISDSPIRSIKAKDPKYRFPVQIDFQKCRKKLQHLLIQFVIVGVSESMLNVML